MRQGQVAADDLTGACDTGHTFAACGYRTRVLIDREGQRSSSSEERRSSGSRVQPDDSQPQAGDEGVTGDTDVLVVDTDSRYDPPRAAADAVRTAINAHPASIIYKKIDSTLRRNLVTEIDAFDATAIELSGEAVETGIPLATIEGGTVAGTALITKAGAFGGTETVVNCLDRLREV